MKNAHTGFEATVSSGELFETAKEEGQDRFEHFFRAPLLDSAMRTLRQMRLRVNTTKTRFKDQKSGVFSSCAINGNMLRRFHAGSKYTVLVSLSAEIPWMRLSSEPTIVTASEMQVELRCAPGDLERWRRKKTQEVTSALELAMAQAAATASKKERSGLLKSIGHFTLNSFNSALRSSMFGSTHLMARETRVLLPTLRSAVLCFGT